MLQSALAAAALALTLPLAIADDAKFHDAMSLYEKLDYEHALPLFADCAARADNDDDKATALLWVGLAAAGTGDLDRAAKTFGDALRLDRSLRLPPDTSPTVVQRFESVRASLPAPAPPRSTTTTTTTTTTTPATPPPVAAATSPGPSLAIVVAGGAAAGVGVLALVGGGISAALASADLAKAHDRDVFAGDARSANDAAGATATASAVLLPVGALLAAGGGVLLWLGLSPAP